MSASEFTADLNGEKETFAAVRHELGQNLEPRNRPPVPCEVAQVDPAVDPPLPRFAAATGLPLKLNQVLPTEVLHFGGPWRAGTRMNHRFSWSRRVVLQKLIPVKLPV